MNTDDTQVVETIDLTPSWKTAVRIYCAVLQNADADPSTQWEAEQELLKLAGAMDKVNAEKKEKRELIAQLEIDAQIAIDEGADITDGASDDEK